MSASPLLQLAISTHSKICFLPSGEFSRDVPPPRAIFPGSYNPLHAAHRELAEVATRCLGLPIEFELSITNVDKPSLDEAAILERVAQFVGYAPIWITTAPTFEQKAELFPNTVFVMGFDTAIRLIDPKYYRGDPVRRDACLRKIRQQNCSVLVGGRRMHNTFCIWDPQLVAPEFHDLFVILQEADFRHDLSSTELREALATRPVGE